MLILSRKLNESIVIDGRIIVKVLRIDKDTVKLGIQAPAELPVHREEIHEVIQRNKQAGIEKAPSSAAGGASNQGPVGDKRPSK
jgi:carbon storage regulator